MFEGTSGRVLLVGSACVLLALGVGGLEQSAVPLADDAPLWAVRAVGMALALGALGGAWWYRRRLTGGGPGGDPIASSLIATFVTLGMFAMLSLLPPLVGTGGLGGAGDPPPEQVARGGGDRTAVDPPLGNLGGAGRADPQDREEEEVGAFPELAPIEEEAGEPGPEMMLLRRGAMILAALVLAMVAYGWLRQALRARRPTRGLQVEPPEEPAAAREVRAAMERSVTELAARGRPPRSQITGAYHRLLSVLEEAGYPRPPQEAPHEHLQRSLVSLGVAPDPMRRLTELYVFAEFGRGEVGPGHREAAAEALAASLAGLRSRYPGVGPGVREGRAR